MKKLKYNETEQLKIGERAEYILDNEDIPSPLGKRLAKLDIKMWMEKRAPSKDQIEQDRILRPFIDLGRPYQMVFGITWRGHEYECGSVPTYISYTTRGIEFALSVLDDEATSNSNR